MGFLDRFKKDASEPDAYTKEVTIRVRAMAEVEAVEPIDADHLAVRWAGRAEPVEVSIAGHRERWQAASGFDRIEVVDELLDTIAEPGDGGAFDATTLPGPSPEVAPELPAEPEASTGAGWDDAAGRVLPALRRPTGDDAVAWPVGGLVEAVVVLDGAPVTAGVLADWGVDADATRDAALANLGDHDPGLDPVAPDTRAWVPTAPQGGQAAWLAAPDVLLRAAGLDVAIVFVPTPTDLVVVDPADADLVASITTSTLAIVDQETTTIAPVPFEVRPGHVGPWRPPAGHPCAELVDRAHAAFEGR